MDTSVRKLTYMDKEIIKNRLLEIRDFLLSVPGNDITLSISTSKNLYPYFEFNLIAETNIVRREISGLGHYKAPKLSVLRIEEGSFSTSGIPTNEMVRERDLIGQNMYRAKNFEQLMKYFEGMNRRGILDYIKFLKDQDKKLYWENEGKHFEKYVCSSNNYDVVIGKYGGVKITFLVSCSSRYKTKGTVELGKFFRYEDDELDTIAVECIFPYYIRSSF